MKIRINLFIVSSLIVTLALLFSTLMFLAQMRSEAFERAKIEQEQALRTFWQLLLAKGSDFRLVDGKLLAGSYVINGNYELPDKIREIFGGTATIFMGDTRVSTNVLQADGRRAVGTRLTGPAYDTVFRGNRAYRGEAPILGIPYFTAYDPIRDRNGTTIGILYVGIKKSEFLAGYHHLVVQVVAGAVILEILLTAITCGLLRERSLADARSREMANRLRLITDSVPVSIAYVDTRMRYLFANKRYEELFGVAGAEGVVGRSVEDVVGDTFFSSREENIRKALAGNEVMFSHETPRRDGSRLVLQTAYIPHRAERGRVVGYFIQHYDITDLTRAQDALRASEEQYRTLFETTGTAMFVSEDDTTVSLVNHEFTRLAGYARGEVEGVLSWTAFVTPASRERMLVYHKNRRIDPSLAPHAYECDVIRRDGSLRNILAHVNLFPGTRRSIISFLDITRHKQLDASLHNQLTFLQTLINTIPNPIFYKDRDGRYTGCNIAFEQYLGLTREEIVGKGVDDLAPPELAAKYREMDDKLFASPGVQVYDASVVYADGTLHDVIFSKATFSGENGRVEGLVGVILDLTERKKTEDALRESEDRFHRLFTQNDDAIILFRLDNLTVIDANPAAERLTGYAPVELKTISPFSLVDQDVFRLLIDSIPDNHEQAFQLDRTTICRKDGSSAIVAIRAKVLRLRDEYIMHCSLRDIAEKVRLEEEIRSTQAKLIHTNKMASIGMLASSVAHEINNPNNCISINAAMMADIWQDAEPLLAKAQAEQGDFTLRGIPFSKMRDFAPRLLNGIVEGSRRITTIVHNMRDYVREDKSGLQGEIDVNRLLQNAAAILWHHIHVHTDNFQLDLEEDLPLARGNGQQIEQVIINLIMNALQALTDKSAGVFVTTSSNRAAGTLTITVRDEGKGMDDTVLSHLKEPFFTTKLSEGGTGLGLYISDSILKEHHGALEFDSRVGRGTTATMMLRQAKNHS